MADMKEFLFAPKVQIPLALGFEDDSRIQNIHIWEEDDVWAVRTAMLTGCPLLLRGEPGSGKSQLARAIAEYFRSPLVKTVVNSRTTIEDLLYRHDAVARLAEAQILVHGSAERTRDQLDHKYFIYPGPVWWAFNWTNAHNVACESKCEIRRPETPTAWDGNSPAVLLIDEIDKATSDLPNALLECFSASQFLVPFINTHVKVGETRPIVIVATNEERELPSAFVRRCVVHNLSGFTLQKNTFIDYLVKRGIAFVEQNGGEKILTEAVLAPVAFAIWEERKRSATDEPKPGLAEFMDLVRAAVQMQEWPDLGSNLAKMQRYVVDKHRQFRNS